MSELDVLRLILSESTAFKDRIGCACQGHNINSRAMRMSDYPIKLFDTKSQRNWKGDVVAGLVIAGIACIVPFFVQASSVYSASYLACEEDRRESNKIMSDNLYGMHFVRLRRVQIALEIKKESRIQQNLEKSQRSDAWKIDYKQKITNLSDSESKNILKNLEGVSLEEMSRNVYSVLRRWENRKEETKVQNLSKYAEIISAESSRLIGLYLHNSIPLSKWIESNEYYFRSADNLINEFVKNTKNGLAGGDETRFDSEDQPGQILKTSADLVDASESGIIPESVCKSRAWASVFPTL